MAVNHLAFLMMTFDNTTKISESMWRLIVQTLKSVYHTWIIILCVVQYLTSLISFRLSGCCVRVLARHLSATSSRSPNAWPTSWLTPPRAALTATPSRRKTNSSVSLSPTDNTQDPEERGKEQFLSFLFFVCCYFFKNVCPCESLDGTIKYNWKNELGYLYLMKILFTISTY